MNWVILGRVLLSVSGNTIQKRLAGRGMSILALWLVTYILMLVPLAALCLPRAPHLSGAFWINAMLGGLLDALGNLAMVAALRSTDLSVFGPLNAFRPVIALLAGWLFLGETPTLYGASGVMVIVAGAALLLRGRRGSAPTDINKKPSTLPVILRVLGLSLSSVGAVFLKRAAGLADAEVVLGAWTACGLVCLLVAAMWRRPSSWLSLGPLARGSWSWLLLHALIFGAMQWITIRIFTGTLLAYSFAYFQLGMVLQVVVGAVFFREPGLWWRLASGLVMGLGACLMTWKG